MYWYFRESQLSKTRSTPAGFSTSLSLTKLVLIHLFMLAYWGIAIIHVSPPGPLHYILSAQIAPFCSALNINQHWNMFSAPLRDYNETAQALITFSDGSVELYEFLRLDLLDPVQKWRRGKLRELLFDTLLNQDQYRELYPSVSRFIAKAHENPENEPVQVRLAGNWVKIPPFSKPCTLEDMPQNRYHTTMFVYQVDPRFLK